jgi:hypothetical protein
MATLTLALVRCYGLFCRAFPGHAADPRDQHCHLTSSLPFCAALSSEAPTRGGAVAIVLREAALDRRPSWRAALSHGDGQESVLPFRRTARAKRVELTPARRQNAEWID